MNVWTATSPCSPSRCVTSELPPVSTSEAIARGAALLKVLASTGPLDVRARRVFDALGIGLDTDPAPRAALSAGGDTGTLIVANHISWLDILAVMAVEPATFLAKREVGNWPLLGGLATKAGTLFVDRWSLRALPDSVAVVADTLRQGTSVAVFPEATTWCSGKGGVFRRAMFQAAIDANAPIRPVTLSYTQEDKPSTVAAFVGDDTLARSIARVSKARDLRARLTARPLIEPTGDRRELAALAQHAVLADAEPVHA
ncbi:1-acyl-sn-glycerol-3-phosphate acyltransferases [Prauserella marina]|uniref:1-acyl-sn-glycerol-3-phosphate acyltransferases n=1 Tax=Prauserella marina TaxID=530584 RepID=A0A1G6NWB9_9PSEU|nr:lysophospholipid acyltransferase family protein [Prauserella marina]PWV82543.1 1-acyl-sn-glycerol-3-phosphate acyltransferase [Prauserella marina]SDC71644.1 1-acyl-sn-glycerol-3-phosphate acyltransferases [Prauserella marina]